ncbi:MAG: SPOR domain-containing protein [bacterium]|nr:SPOR domain-containing protein [bacterium]
MYPKKSDSEKKVGSVRCVCTETTGLFVPNRQLSFVVAGVVLGLFFSFIIGFFGGQRYVISQFSGKLNQDSFADQIYSSLCALDQNIENVGETECEPDNQESSDEGSDQESPESIVLNNREEAAIQSEPRQAFYAQLVGFGTLRAAQRFMQRLTQQDIPVYIKTRHSKTARGKNIAWYQVVTESFEDKEKLTALVDKITEQEKLKDVHITAC